MKVINQETLTGERALFQAQGMKITQSIFEDGESPLKESKHLEISDTQFRWKYPLWYSSHVAMSESHLHETARSGIWYTNHITIENTVIQAPKSFRRSKGIVLKNVSMPNALETLWHCQDITFEHVDAKGDYFGMDSSNIKIQDFRLDGNYGFDGAKNIEIRNAILNSKDAFWNAENVTVIDSAIVGEYLGWNSKNLTFINCTIESLQGLCYIENLVMENCRFVNTTLAFEYSTIDVSIQGSIDSVMNPISGVLKADGIGELIMDETKIDPKQTQVIIGGQTFEL